MSAGFRPFFLAAGLWACIAMVVWMLILRGVMTLPTTLGPVAWHFHELLYGFVAAAIAGFLLTAIPNWTGRQSLQGWTLGSLVLLWILGRITVAFSAWTGAFLAAAVDLSFLLVLVVVAGREIVAGRNWRNLPVVIAVALLIAANAMIHTGTFAGGDVQGAGKRLAVSIILMLISLIGGRIIPSFTTNWLRQRDASALPAPFGRLDKAVLAVSVLALAAWVIIGLTPVSGAALLLAAAGHAVRLARWRAVATVREPLLWILHLGYAWLPIGIALLGMAAWRPGLSTTALHALTVGAMGTMILAVMTRASLGHSKRELSAGYGTLAVYILVLVAAGARVAAPLLDSGYTAALDLAGGAWIAAFALFVALYLPLFTRS